MGAYSSAEGIIIDVLSFASLVLVITPLIPQVYHNYKRQSTEGLSTYMLVFFLLGGLAPAAYYVYSDQPILLTASWFGFSLISILIICQIRYYQTQTDRSRDKGITTDDHHIHTPLNDPLIDGDDQLATDSINRPSVVRRRLMFFVHFVVILVTSTALVAGFYVLFIHTSTSIIPSAMGLVLPVVFNFCGFCCQYAVIIEYKSSEGVALGFTVIDLTACTLSIITICLNDLNIAALAPCCSIIACQFILLLFRFVIYPNTSPLESDTNPSVILEE